MLAIQLKRIGDLALTTPALHALKSAGNHVTLVVAEGSAALLPMLTEDVDNALVYHQRGGNRALWTRIWRGDFDACVDFTGRDRSALMSLVSRARKRVTADALLRGSGWRRLCYNVVADAPVRSRHTVDHYLDFLRPILPSGDTRPAADRPRLRVPPATMAAAAALLEAHGIGATERFVVIHPGSARPEKYWRADRWAEVIEFCQRVLGRRCALTGGRHDPDEQTHLAAIRAALSTRQQTCVDLVGQLDLPTLTAVLSRASLVVGVDSGPMHLAAAWQRPQIVLFGPTNPFHWHPRHPAALVLRAGQGDLPFSEFTERSPGASMDQISTRAVIGSIKQATKGASSDFSINEHKS